MTSQQIKGFAAAIAAAVCYGTNPLGTLPLYAEGITSASVLAYRYGLAVIMFGLVMLATRQSIKIKLGHAIRFAVLGAMFATSSLTLYHSFHHMAAGIASTLLFVYPVMTAVLMTALFHEKLTYTTAASILLALCGVGLLYRGGDGDNLSTVGFLLVMFSSLSYAFYIVSVNRWKTSMTPIKFTFWILVFCFIWLMVYAAMSGEQLQWLTTPKQWLCGVQLALLPTVLSLYFMTISIKLIGSTPSAIMGALEPVTAVIIGVFIFGESFSLRLFCGIVLILIAVTLIILRPQKTK